MSINYTMDKAISLFGWNDQTQVAVLMDFIDDLVRQGVISSEDIEAAFEKKMNEEMEASNEDA